MKILRWFKDRKYPLTVMLILVSILGLYQNCLKKVVSAGNSDPLIEQFITVDDASDIFFQGTIPAVRFSQDQYIQFFDDQVVVELKRTSSSPVGAFAVKIDLARDLDAEMLDLAGFEHDLPIIVDFDPEERAQQIRLPLKLVSERESLDELLDIKLTAEELSTETIHTAVVQLTNHEVILPSLVSFSRSQYQLVSGSPLILTIQRTGDLSERDVVIEAFSGSARLNRHIALEEAIAVSFQEAEEEIELEIPVDHLMRSTHGLFFSLVIQEDDGVKLGRQHTAIIHIVKSQGTL